MRRFTTDYDHYVDDDATGRSQFYGSISPGFFFLFCFKRNFSLGLLFNFPLTPFFSLSGIIYPRDWCLYLTSGRRRTRSTSVVCALVPGKKIRLSFLHIERAHSVGFQFEFSARKRPERKRNNNNYHFYLISAAGC